MNAKRRREINRFAGEMRQALELDVPVDIQRAVERLGGTVVEADRAVEASVQKRDDSFLITVRTDSVDTRRRFSIAHELGHLFLHMGYLAADGRWDRIDAYCDSPLHRFGHSEEECDADEFASAFLMPDAEFRKEVAANTTEQRNVHLRPIAERFAVSIEAARVRGRQLGLLDG